MIAMTSSLGTRVFRDAVLTFNELLSRTYLNRREGGADHRDRRYKESILRLLRSDGDVVKLVLSCGVCSPGGSAKVFCSAGGNRLSIYPIANSLHKTRSSDVNLRKRNESKSCGREMKRIDACCEYVKGLGLRWT